MVGLTLILILIFKLLLLLILILPTHSTIITTKISVLVPQY